MASGIIAKHSLDYFIFYPGLRLTILKPEMGQPKAEVQIFKINKLENQAN